MSHTQFLLILIILKLEHTHMSHTQFILIFIILKLEHTHMSHIHTVCTNPYPVMHTKASVHVQESQLQLKWCFSTDFEANQIRQHAH